MVYYVTVRAWNGAGEYIDALSDGVMVDSVPPRSGLVLDGRSNRTDIDWQSATDSLSLTWSGFIDAHSGLAGVHVAIGRAHGGTDIVPFTDTQMVSEVPEVALVPEVPKVIPVPEVSEGSQSRITDHFAGGALE